MRVRSTISPVSELARDQQLAVVEAVLQLDRRRAEPRCDTTFSAGGQCFGRLDAVQRRHKRREQCQRSEPAENAEEAVECHG